MEQKQMKLTNLQKNKCPVCGKPLYWGHDMFKRRVYSCLCGFIIDEKRFALTVSNLVRAELKGQV